MVFHQAVEELFGQGASMEDSGAPELNSIFKFPANLIFFQSGNLLSSYVNVKFKTTRTNT